MHDPSDTEAALDRTAAIVRSASGIVVLTGAGISAESRIPTYRDAMEGLWASFDPQRLATPEAFAADPETVTRWYDFRRLRCAEAEPNPGHLALAALQAWCAARGTPFTLLTQNVDRLHQRAGSTDVVELHGTIMAWRDAETGEPWSPPEPPEPIRDFPPRTDRGHLARPDVVWFGEMLPPAAVGIASEAVGSCDVFLSVGTSSQVYPAAGFAEAVSRHGGRVIEVNPESTPLTRLAAAVLRGRSGAMLPALLARAGVVGV